MNNYLQHHGIKGMKWGVRRYQNEDGSLTAAGKKRYDSRQNTINEYTESIKRTKKYIEKDENDLRDLNKNGKNSKVFKKAYGNDTLDDYKSLGYSSRKEMIDYLKRDIKSNISSDKKYIKDYSNRIEAIKNTPINKLTYEESDKRSLAIAKAAGIATAAGNIAVSGLMYKRGWIDGSTALKLSGLGVGLGLGESIRVYNKLDNKEYKKRFGG